MTNVLQIKYTAVYSPITELVTLVNLNLYISHYVYCETEATGPFWICDITLT